MIAFLFIGASQAKVYQCVKLEQLEGLKSSRFQSYETGWVGATNDGLLRIYVGNSEEEAQQWVVSMKQQLYNYNFTVILDRGDEAYGDQQNIIMVRYGNVGLLSQGKNVIPWMFTLEKLLIGTPSFWENSCKPEVTSNVKETYQIVLSDDCYFNYTGGEPIYTEHDLSFSKLPDQITIWDKCTRPTIWAPSYDSKSFTPREKSLGSHPK
jgi:hypothetical protein